MAENDGIKLVNVTHSRCLRSLPGRCCYTCALSMSAVAAWSRLLHLRPPALVVHTMARNEFRTMAIAPTQVLLARKP
jgi:hypothetical protein